MCIWVLLEILKAMKLEKGCFGSVQAFLKGLAYLLFYEGILSMCTVAHAWLLMQTVDIDMNKKEWDHLEDNGKGGCFQLDLTFVKY